MLFVSLYKATHVPNTGTDFKTSLSDVLDISVSITSPVNCIRCELPIEATKSVDICLVIDI